MATLPDRSQAELLDRAQEVATRHDATVDGLRGKRIRVLRAVVYEGEAEAVFAQLANSLPPGLRGVEYGAEVIEQCLRTARPGPGVLTTSRRPLSREVA